jgi:hypothetical protein
MTAQLDRDVEEIKRCTDVLMTCVDERLSDFRPVIVVRALIAEAFIFAICTSRKETPAASADFAEFLETTAADIRNRKILSYLPDDASES